MNMSLWFIVALFLQGGLCLPRNDLEVVSDGSKNAAPTFGYSAINADHVVIAWRREGSWTDETRYHLSIRNPASPGMNWCYSNTIICFQVECSIDTKSICPFPMNPCSSYSIKLEGEIVASEWQYVQTSPDDYGGLNLEVAGNSLHITWLWPENPPQEEICLGEFILNVTTVGKTEIVNVPRRLHPTDLITKKDITLMYDYPLGTCDTGGGTVRLQASGASGASDGQVLGFTYVGDGDPVVILNPKEVTSTTIKAIWELSESCPLINTFAMYAIDAVHENFYGPYHTTQKEYTFRNLIPGTQHSVCVLPIGAFGDTLPAGDNECQTITTLAE